MLSPPENTMSDIKVLVAHNCRSVTTDWVIDDHDLAMFFEQRMNKSDRYWRTSLVEEIYLDPPRKPKPVVFLDGRKVAQANAKMLSKSRKDRLNKD